MIDEHKAQRLQALKDAYERMLARHAEASELDDNELDDKQVDEEIGELPW
jgi:hypothetical protein